MVAQAGEASRLESDPVVEQRLVSLAENLRCLVCQNESLADSQANLAQDLRREIRHLIQSGKTDDDIQEFLANRYGDFVLYQPPLKPVTWLLWLGPWMVLLGAFWMMVRAIRQTQYNASKPITHDACRPCYNMPGHPAPPRCWNARQTTLTMGIVIPVMALGVYAIHQVTSANANTHSTIDALVVPLTAHPDDLQAWVQLAQAYKIRGQLDMAEQAFEKAQALVKTEPDLLVDYADVLATRANNHLAGNPLKLVNQALELNPNHLAALMMSGSAAYQRSDFKLAIEQWEKVLTALPAHSPEFELVESEIKKAKLATCTIQKCDSV